MKQIEDYPEKVYLGTTTVGRVYLSRPRWVETGTYWAFGYIGNDNAHYHLNGIGQIDRSVEHFHLRDQLVRGFSGRGAVARMDKNNTLWTFCEVVETIYTLKQTASVLSRGGSNVSENPVAEFVKNPAEVSRINEEVIPRLIVEMYRALGIA